jgi:hypothetical protein
VIAGPLKKATILFGTTISERRGRERERRRQQQSEEKERKKESG